MWRPMFGTCATVAAIMALTVPTSLAQPVQVLGSGNVTVYAGAIVTYKNKVFAGAGASTPSKGWGKGRINIAIAHLFIHCWPFPRHLTLSQASVVMA